MKTSDPRGVVAPAALLLTVLAVAAALVTWKTGVGRADAASANPPEPMEFVTLAVARYVEHLPTTTAVGTVRARRSITLRNELPGTVRWVQLHPGTVVDEGSVLVKLDVSVEEAELVALRAQADLARTMLERYRRASDDRAISELEVDRARAERDVANAQIARLEAVIDRKIIRAPFKARVGMADLHLGQYLDEGTELTTLQGIDTVAHVDFTVAQAVAALLAPGDSVEVLLGDDGVATRGIVVAVDSRVDPATRNATVRARIENGAQGPAPGAAVRVRVPVAPATAHVAVPVSALRTGPDGDHVFVLSNDESGHPRAHRRPVQSGAVLGDEVVIEAGLQYGERVAASGSFKLREAVLVAVAGDGVDAGGGSR